jgi:hypothetical protein
VDLIAVVPAVQRRLRFGAVLSGAAAGLVLLAATLLLSGLTGIPREIAAAVAGVAAIVVMATISNRGLKHSTLEAAASRIEAVSGGLDNLLTTATALGAGRLQASSRMSAEVIRQATERTATVRPASAAPLLGPIALALAALAGAGAVSWSAFSRPRPSSIEIAAPVHGTIRDVRATITSPAYIVRHPQVLENPEQLLVPEGGRVRIELSSSAPAAWLVEPGQPVRSLTAEGAERFAAEWSPAGSNVVVLAVGPRAAEPADSRVVNVMVTPDTAPRVRITSPAHDLAFIDSRQAVDIAIDASDAEALMGLRLVYVRMSGSGESFAFAEGAIPVAVEKANEREWHGHARLLLSSLKLDDGESIVYRALVRDSNPHAGWLESEAYTIEVGKRLEFASSGSAVPGEERRYALSQQMVIVKTERLQAERPRPDTASWAERTRLLAMEQRMVRAEVVFLSGGEVEDEVVEAEQANELQEGRLQNAGRAEMLRAINDMSRAEARLNAGDTAGALGFERSALAALQRAFDRRRYFLRTLGERSRIDPSRRLTGDSSKARPAGRDPRRDPGSEVELARQLIHDLAAIGESGVAPDAGLLGRLASIEPGSNDWRLIAASLAAAVTPEARREAAERAMVRLSSYARTRSGASAAAPPLNELQGWWREETRSGERR